MNADYCFKPLCAAAQLQIEAKAQQLLLEVLECGIPIKELYPVCHNAVRIYFTTLCAGKQAFSSPKEVLDTLDLEQMAELLAGGKTQQWEEGAVNESFQELG